LKATIFGGALMKKKIVLLLGLLAIITLAIGCATYVAVDTERGRIYRLIESDFTGPTRVELDYGTSYNLAKYGQILNPEAEKNLEPVVGMDGQVTEIVVDKYRKGFEKEKPRPVYNINIGGF
jgi:hypothetical protein